MQRVQGEKTISDVSQTEYQAGGTPPSQDSSDSYDSGSETSTSSSSSGSDSDEVKVVVAPDN